MKTPSNSSKTAETHLPTSKHYATSFVHKREASWRQPTARSRIQQLRAAPGAPEDAGTPGLVEGDPQRHVVVEELEAPLRIPRPRTQITCN